MLVKKNFPENTLYLTMLSNAYFDLLRKGRLLDSVPWNYVYFRGKIVNISFKLQIYFQISIVKDAKSILLQRNPFKRPK